MKTTQDIPSRLFLSEFTIPEGTEVRELTPDECPSARGLLVVVNPRDIPEFHTNSILRHDLTHRFAFVSDRLVSE
tara:strand:+ start:299 stop:523 length:225 start_codon:yes stop_codon:yes gene_type:complete